MCNTEAKIREINHCKRMLIERQKALLGTSNGLNIYGLREAVMIMMLRKKDLQAELAAQRENKCQQPSNNRNRKP